MKTEEEIKEKAEHYIMDYGGNMLTAGSVFFDGKRRVWITPIFFGLKFADFPLDELEFNEDGDLIYAPSREKLSKLIKVRFESVNEKALAEPIQ